MNDASLGLNVGSEEGHNAEDDDDGLYKDANINLEGRDVQMTYVHTIQEFEDTHVTLNLVNPDGQQQSSLRDEAQAENEEFINNLDKNIQKIIKEQVKVQVSKILPRIKKNVNDQLEAEVLTQSSNSSKTSYAVAADLSEMELKKILIDKIKSNKEGKEPESTSAPKEKATNTTGKSTQGSKSHQKITTESAPAEELMQITQDLEEPSHQEFKTGAADDQPIISDLAKQADSHSSFNVLMDTHVDFLAFLMNLVKVDTLTPELLAGPTYRLMKGSCKSLVELKFFLEEVYKETTDQLDWNNHKGQLWHIKCIEELVPRIMWSQEPVGHNKYALWGISHGGRKCQQFYEFAVNKEFARDVYSKCRIIVVIELYIVEWHNYKHLDWITVRRDDEKLYKFKEGDFKRLHNQDIEDRLVLLVQGKLTNLMVRECFAFNVSLRMFTSSIVIQRHVEDLQLGAKSYQKKLNLTNLDTYRSNLKHKEAYTAYSNPRGFIYQNKDKQNWLAGPVLTFLFPWASRLKNAPYSVTFKRRRDDADKDEEPFAGSDRGSKRRKEGKEPESTSAPKKKATKTTGKSSKGSKSPQKTASDSAPAKEPMQTTQDLEEPTHQEFETCTTDDQPIAEASQHPECDLAKQADSRSSFNELMDTPVDFSAFLMNRLKVDTLTPELLAGPTYELMKGSCKSLVELEFFLKEVYKATTDQLEWNKNEGQQYPHNLLKPLPLIPNSRGRRVIPFDHFINNDLEYLHGGASSRKYTTSVTKTMAADNGHIKWIKDLFYGFAVNMEFARDVYSKCRIIAVTELQIVEWHNYKHLDWITVRRDDDKLYKFTEGKFKRLCIQDIEDMLLLLLNLTKPDTYRFDLKRKEAYIAYSNPIGFIYQNKDKQNRLMRIDELHKFSNGTLNDVRTALNDRLKGIRMKYLPQAIWRRSDKERAAAMIQTIDKQLKTRRIMRSLEKFVGGRLYDGDFRMLQHTI
nr:hypothetical protein [Tanacetum cinerariifolium]